MKLLIYLSGILILIRICFAFLEIFEEDALKQKMSFLETCTPASGIKATSRLPIVMSDVLKQM